MPSLSSGKDVNMQGANVAGRDNITIARDDGQAIIFGMETLQAQIEQQNASLATLSSEVDRLRRELQAVQHEQKNMRAVITMLTVGVGTNTVLLILFVMQLFIFVSGAK